MTATPLALLLALSSAGPARAGDDPSLGLRVWQESCATCHGTQGRGDGPSARHLSAPPSDLSAGMYSLRSTPWDQPPTDEDLARTVRQGIPGSAMPGFQGHLSTGAIQEVVVHLRTLTERWPASVSPTPPLAPDPPSDLPAMTGQGQSLFAANCAACHGEGGRGDGAAADFLVNGQGSPIRPLDLRRDALRGGEQPADIFRAISYGLEGRSMPPFAHLSESERWALVAYVGSLRPRRVPYSVGVDPRPSGEAR